MKTLVVTAQRKPRYTPTAKWRRCCAPINPLWLECRTSDDTSPQCRAAAAWRIGKVDLCDRHAGVALIGQVMADGKCVVRRGPP